MLRSLVLFLFLALVAGRAQSGSPERSLRVMTYNLHHGEGLDGKVDLERMGRLIVAARADLVGLQEVDRGTERTQRRDLAAELARLTGLHSHFEKNIPYQGGAYGNAVLSRFPIKRAKNSLLPLPQPGEQRGVLQAVVEIHGREVLFLNTHLDHRTDDTERRLSIGVLRDIVTAASPMQVILVEDLNATPDSRPIALLREFMTDTWTAAGQGPGYTIPVHSPRKRIDYVWFTPKTITPRTITVIQSEASDHLPVVAELVLK